MNFFSLIFLILIILFIIHIFVKNNVNSRMDKILKEINSDSKDINEKNNLE